MRTVRVYGTQHDPTASAYRANTLLQSILQWLSCTLHLPEQQLL
jgi:hypothetical protein